MSNLDCTNFGACCREMVQPPMDLTDRFNVPDYLLREITHFNAMVRDSLPEVYPCIWLDLVTMKCRHYEHRPAICRDFQIGGDGCMTQRKLHSVSREG